MKKTTKKPTVPYASATTGKNARAEIEKILQAFGCESVGFMDDFADQSVLLAFKHRGRQVQLRASARGWAALYLRQNPWKYSRRTTKQDYDAKALAQGLIAINSIMRDWVKGQITAIETGMLSFEAVFAAHILLPSGKTMLDEIVAVMPPAIEDHHAPSP
jgi:hypothetical protein